MSLSSPIYIHRPSSSPAPLFNLNSLPPETWAHVFECLVESRDLYNVILTCKYLHSLAIRPLYRHLNFSSPLNFLRNVPFWENQITAMQTVPTSLTVSMPYFSQRAAWGGRFDTTSDLLFSNGTFMPLRTYSMSFNNLYPWPTEATPPSSVHPPQSIHNPQLDLSQLHFTASDDIYSMLCARMRTFLNLRELEFESNALPGEIYEVIKSLPSLRKLVFNRCYLPEPTITTADEFINLPITELVIKRIKDEDSTQRLRYRRALRLCYAPNITTLDIDWDPISARILSGLVAPESPDKPLPPAVPHLHTLYLYSAGQWPPDAGIEVHYPLEKFLMEHQDIKWLHIRRFNGTPRIASGLLPNLQVYRGPMCTVAPLVAHARALIEDPMPASEIVEDEEEPSPIPLSSVPQGVVASNVRQVYLTDAGTDKRVDRLVKTLRRMAGLPIEILSVPMPRWDLEVMFPLTLHFPKLRRLEAKYVAGWPDEQTILSLGAQFLHRLPDLEVFHLYNPISPRCTCLSSRALEVRLSTLSPSSPSPSLIFFTPNHPIHTPVAPPMLHTYLSHRPSPPQSSTLDNEWDHTETDPYIISQYTDLPQEDLENIAYEGPLCPRFPDVSPRIHARRRRNDIGLVEIMSEEEIMEVLCAWRKSCPKLREVRLQREWVYRRNDGGQWGWNRERFWCK